MKILVVNVNWLGDVLFSVPALRAIKKGSKEDVYLAVMGPKRCKRILEYSPIVDEIIEFDERVTHRTIFAKLKFIFLLKRKKFDKAIFFHRSFTRILICKLAGIAQREGYYRKKTSFILTKTVPSIDKESVHRVDYFINLVEKLGYQKKSREYNFYITRNNIEEAEKILRKQNVDFLNNDIIAFHPGANWEPKRWPVKHWAELIDLLVSEYKNIRIIITGTEADKELANGIKDKMSNSSEKVIDLTGLTTLGSFAGVLSLCKIMVSGDSGSLHIGCSIKKNFSGDEEDTSPFCLGLFGPTSKNITGPISERVKVKEGERRFDCVVPCYDYSCNDYVCMKSIKPIDVYGIIKKFIERGSF